MKVINERSSTGCNGGRRQGGKEHAGERGAFRRQAAGGIDQRGVGAYAHLPAWRSLEDVEVVGICTSRRETAEKAARQYHIERPFWDYRAMARDPDIDIIDCGTRPNWRRDMVLAALSAGKHVYNGIPFTESFESSRRVMQAWSGSGLVGGVDAFSEWFPAHRMLRELVQDGFLGRPFACNLSFHISLFTNRVATSRTPGSSTGSTVAPHCEIWEAMHYTYY